MKSQIKTNAKKDQDLSDLSKADLAGLYRELHEKDLLLSLNNDIATIKDRKDILRLILPKLKALFGTEDLFICRIDKQKQTLNPFLRVAGKNRENYSGHEKVLEGHFPLSDKFIHTILSAGGPVICDLNDIARNSPAPGYISISMAAGLLESLSAVLYCGDEPIGVFTLWAEKKDSLPLHIKNSWKK